MKVFRRLDNACCAFLHGHSRRDLNRVRLRRIALLLRRAIAQEQRLLDCEGNELARDILQPSVDALRRDLECFVESKGRVPNSAFAQFLHIRRASLQSRRLHELTRRYAVGEITQLPAQDIERLRVSTPEGYGRLYEGLFEDRSKDGFLGKLCFSRCDRHGFAPLFRRFTRCFRTGRNCAPP